MDSYVDLESSGFSAEEFADVKRCLETLFSIRAGSLPIDGDLGMDFDGILDYPMDVAKNMFAVEAIEKVNTYEPRVEVVSVDFATGSDGQLLPHIRFRKREG